MTYLGTGSELRRGCGRGVQRRAHLESGEVHHGAHGRWRTHPAQRRPLDTGSVTHARRLVPQSRRLGQRYRHRTGAGVCEDCCRSVLMATLSMVSGSPVYIQSKRRTGCPFVAELGVQGEALGQRNLQFSSPHGPEIAAIADRLGAHVCPKCADLPNVRSGPDGGAIARGETACEPPSRPWRIR